MQFFSNEPPYFLDFLKKMNWEASPLMIQGHHCGYYYTNAICQELAESTLVCSAGFLRTFLEDSSISPLLYSPQWFLPVSSEATPQPLGLSGGRDTWKNELEYKCKGPVQLSGNQPLSQGTNSIRRVLFVLFTSCPSTEFQHEDIYKHSPSYSL